MKILYKYISVLFTLILLTHCSSDVTKSSNKEITPREESISIEKPKLNDLELDVKGIACWINSMPGNEKPKFHVSGDLLLSKDDEYNLDNIKIKSVVITQDKKEIFYIRPTQDFEIKKEQEQKRIRFSTIKGLRLVEALNKNKSANMEIIFTDNENKFSYYIKNIKIEEAY